MNLFDIIGPVMVGPSSSHTAGAVRIGHTARKLFGEPVVRVEILLYGSFLATGKGHGTDTALVAGLLGMEPDDERIPQAMTYAKEAGMEVTFGETVIKNGHPNSAKLHMVGASGREMEVIGESLGGSLINITAIDGQEANFSGEKPTMIVYNEDTPGLVNKVTGMLSIANVNIATMRLLRSRRGGTAAMVIECDEEIPAACIETLKNSPGIISILYYSAQGDIR